MTCLQHHTYLTSCIHTLNYNCCRDSQEAVEMDCSVDINIHNLKGVLKYGLPPLYNMSRCAWNIRACCFYEWHFTPTVNCSHDCVWRPRRVTMSWHVQVWNRSQWCIQCWYTTSQEHWSMDVTLGDYLSRGLTCSWALLFFRWTSFSAFDRLSTCFCPFLQRWFKVFCSRWRYGNSSNRYGMMSSSVGFAGTKKSSNERENSKEEIIVICENSSRHKTGICSLMGESRFQIF